MAIKTTNQSDFRNNIKKFVDDVVENDTVLFVSSKKGTVVVLSQNKYNQITETVNIPIK